jgi:hypothetical protein
VCGCPCAGGVVRNGAVPTSTRSGAGDAEGARGPAPDSPWHPGELHCDSRTHVTVSVFAPAPRAHAQARDWVQRGCCLGCAFACAGLPATTKAELEACPRLSGMQVAELAASLPQLLQPLLYPPGVPYEVRGGGPAGRRPARQEPWMSQGAPEHNEQGPLVVGLAGRPSRPLCARLGLSGAGGRPPGQRGGGAALPAQAPAAGARASRRRRGPASAAAAGPQLVPRVSAGMGFQRPWQGGGRPSARGRAGGGGSGCASRVCPASLLWAQVRV